MTASVIEAASGPYFPNGATTAFPFTFKALDDGPPTVVLIADDGSASVVDPGAYVVTLPGDVLLDGEGGTVTFTVAPPNDGSALWVLSDPDFAQEILFESEGPFNVETLNPLADRAAMRINVLRALGMRSIRARLWEPEFTPLPVAAERANSIVGFDGTGDLELTSPAGFAAEVQDELDLNIRTINQGRLHAPELAISQTAIWDDPTPIDTPSTFNAIKLAVTRTSVGTYVPHTLIDTNVDGSAPFRLLASGEIVLNGTYGGPSAVFGAGMRAQGEKLVLTVAQDTLTGIARGAQAVTFDWAGGATGQTMFMTSYGASRFHQFSLGAFVRESNNGRFEQEVAAAAGISIVTETPYIGSSAIGATKEWNTSGQTPTRSNPLFALRQRNTEASFKTLVVGTLTTSGNTRVDFGYWRANGELMTQLVDLPEQTAPGTPAAATLRLYSYRVGAGPSRLAVIDGDGLISPIGPQNLSPSQGGFYPNIVEPEVQSAAPGVGTSYHYTCPAGKKAIYFALQWSNGAAADQWLAMAQISGADRAVTGGPIAAAAATYGTVQLFSGISGMPVLLLAGDKAGINISGVAGVTTMTIPSLFILEFDASSPLTAASLSAFTGGGAYQDMLTVSAGYSAALGVQLPSGAGSSAVGVGYVNASGGARTITIRKVSSGGVTVTLFTGVVGPGTAINRGLGGGLGPGGKIQIASDSNAAGQSAQIIAMPRKL